MSSPTETKLPDHPAKRTGTILVGMGVLGLLATVPGTVGAFLVGASPPVATALIGAGMGGLFVYLGIFTRRVASAVPLVNRSMALLASGAARQAEAFIAESDKAVRVAYLRRTLEVQRALIAIGRGDTVAARAACDAVIGKPPGWMSRQHDRTQITAAHSIRAVARAASGDADGARADVEAVRASPAVQTDMLGRAAFAELLLLERAGDREALRVHLVRNKRLLLDDAAPRERKLIRAYQRMLLTGATSVYRKDAAGDAADDRPADFSTWMSDAERSAPQVDPTAVTGASGEVDDGLLAKADRRLGAPPGSPSKKLAFTLGLWVLLILMFVGIWQFLAPDGAPSALPAAPPPVVDEVEPPIWASPWLALPLVALLIAPLVLRARRLERQLLAGIRKAALGEAGAEAALAALAASSVPLVRAQAERELAHLDERATRFESALARCDRAIDALAKSANVKLVASDLLLPDLTAARAFALLALDRPAEALAELVLLEKRFPSFVFAARASFRLRLLDAVRRNDLAAAPALAAQADTLALSVRDVALAELFLGVARPESTSDADRRRMAAELRDDPETRRWIQALAPHVLSGFEQAVSAA
jgi:hypothetical protein